MVEHLLHLNPTESALGFRGFFSLSLIEYFITSLKQKF